MSEQTCKRCRRVCFSTEELFSHDCFDTDDKLDAEVALANWDGKLLEDSHLKCVVKNGRCIYCASTIREIEATGDTCFRPRPDPPAGGEGRAE